MARGYLGKISAVISANTGDYVRKLNESAKETRAFASTVQNTLGRASKDAAQSLNSIFTPLQKVERALRAAASQKLAFRGFDGAIRDVQSLQAAIAKLTDQRTIDLVVKTSGVGSLEELKRTINVLRNQDVTVGVEGLRAQRAAQQAAGANFIGPVTLQVKQEGDRLDAVIEALERIDAERIKQISLQVEDAQLTAATTQFRRLTELSTQIGAPLAKVQSEFSGLAGTIQAQFIPALSRTQSAYEQFQQRIKEGADLAGSEFRGLADDVRVLEASIGRLRETSAAGGRLFSGEELTFVRPQVVDELNKLAAAQQKLAAAPAAARGSPIARDLLAKAQILREQIERVSARIERLNSQGLDITVSQAGLDLAIRRLQEVRRLTEDIASPPQPPEIRIDVDLADVENSGRQLQAAFVDRIRAIDTAWDQAVRGLTGSTDDIDRRFFSLARTIESLGVGDRVDLDPAIAEFRNAVAAGEGYARQLELLSQLEQQVGERQSFNSMQGSPTGTFGPPPPPRDPGLDLGTDIASSQRALDNLRGSITSVKGQIDSLPAGLRGQFIPAIQGAEAEYRRLFLTAGATTEEIAEAAARLANLEQRIATAANAARQFGGTFAQFRDSIDARAAAGGLEFLRTALSRATGDATQAAAALDRLAEAYQEAASTPGGFQRNAADLQRLANEAIEATAAVAGVGQSEARLRRGFARTGDVARGAFGNTGLAIQQAAFAFEDFFSVTGGLDQRIRAAGNNISQLGFILGGTTGLIVGISAAIGAQLVAALIRWYNEGRTAEDQTKSLTQSLERQKSVVEQLAQSYEKVADAIREAGLSERGRREAGIRRQVEEIQRQQRQAREGRILGADEGVATARASVATAERELAGATTAGQQVRARLRLNAAQERQRAEERRALEAAGRPVGDFRQAAIDAISESIRRSSEQTVRTASVVPGLPFAATFGAAQVGAEEATRERLAALQNIGQSPRDAVAALDEYIRELLDRGESGDVLLPLQQLREQILVYTRQLESDNIAARISRGALQIVAAMEGAQDDIAAAFDGIRGASAIESEIAAFGESLAQLQKAASDAAQRGDLEQVQAFNEDIEYIRRHINALQDAASAVRTFGTALQRFSESVARDLESLEQRADAARRADIAQGTPRSGGARERADRDVREARRAQRQFEDERAAAVERFEERAIRNGDRRLTRIREIDAMLAAPMGGVGADGTRGGTAAEREAAREERRRLQEDIDREVENDPAVRRARASADDATRRAEMAAMADRGRELLLRPGQRARLELDQQLRELDAALQSRINEAIKAGRPQDIATIRSEDAEARKRLQEEAFRQQAPAIFGLADAVQNAILQGPSRAALQPTDVSTVEGSRELTRLLRGDDAARDQANLVELQKEANRLLDLIANNPANIAN